MVDRLADRLYNGVRFVKREVHLLPPLVLVVIAWVLGLLAAQAWLVPYGTPAGVVALLCLLPLGAILLWRRDPKLPFSAICAMVLLLGALRYQCSLPSLSDPALVAHYNDRGWVTAEGIVSGYPDRRDTQTLLRVDVSALVSEGRARAVHGTILVRLPSFPEYRFGDRLRLSGLLDTPPELDGFSYRQYLAQRGIYSILEHPKVELLASGQGNRLWAILYRAKDRLRLTIAQLLEAPESSLLQGILLGTRSEIPDAVYDEFNATSTSHVLVISGANVIIVTALLGRTLGRLFGRRRGYWLTMTGLAGYVLLVGADMPVFRAGVMGGLYLTGRHLGRGTIPYVPLCAAALVLTAVSPWALWDASFQLSFMATAGLIFLADPLESLMERHLWRRVSGKGLKASLRQFGEAVAVTLAPQLVVLPLIATSFGRLSLVAPLANILVGPVQPLIMVWGAVATLIGLVPWLLPVARVVAWLPWLLLAYTRTTVHWIASWPSASIPVSHTASLCLGLGVYGCLAGAALALHHKTWQRSAASLARTAPGRSGVGVAVLAVTILALTIRQLPDRRLHVEFLDVGQGDAILITTPRGQQVLVDGGPSPSALFAALGEAMPFWDRSIDLVVSTHADRDHITGLVSLLQRYDVEGWIDNGYEGSDPLLQECLDRLKEEGIRRLQTAAGDRIELDDGTFLDVIHPRSRQATGETGGSNNNSVVLLLQHGSNSFLLTGDIEAVTEQILVQSARELRADVLKVAHHGSAGSTTQEFLRAVDPSFAVISVGSENWSSHPAPETLERLTGVRNLLVLRTDLQGSVEFVSDGRQIWVKTER